MRSITFHFGGLEQLARALDGGDFEIALPPGTQVTDGEWLLALFEIAHQEIAAAGRAMVRNEATMIHFAERDWRRLEALARAGRGEPPSSASFSVSLSTETEATRGIEARVLVVDDEPLVLEMVGAMLESAGLRVETVEDGELALAKIQKGEIDLLVIDCHLPGMSGIELCRAIRQEMAEKRLPVLFLTASCSSRDMVEAFTAGADDYMLKPFRAPELRARIFGLLRRAASLSRTG